MIKEDELTSPNSCLNRAFPTEMVFVLLARDAAAPVAIRAWVSERLRLRKNKLEDQQIKDALFCAESMDRQREGINRPEPVAWAIYDKGSDELLGVEPTKPEETAGEYLVPLYPR